MNCTVFALFILFSSLSVVYALNFDNMNIYGDMYNKKIGHAPEVLRSMVGDENVEFTISLNNGSSIQWWMELEKAKIVRSGYGGLEDATIEVTATEAALNNVLHAEDPVAAYQEAESSGQMTIDGKTFKSGIKITAALNLGNVINSFIASLA